MTEIQTDEAALAALMRAAQGGDAIAYARFLKLLAPVVRRNVRSLRRFLSADDIEDIVQDVLISVHTVRSTYDPGRPLIPWVLAIMRNRIVDAARRYVRRSAHEIQVNEFPVTFADEDANIETDVYGDPDALKQAIRELPAGQREAVEMLKLRQLSLKEAAAASGTSVGALKVSVHRAISALRRSLAKE